MLKQARKMAKPDKSGPSDDSGNEHFNTTKYPSISSQEDFDKASFGEFK